MKFNVEYKKEEAFFTPLAGLSAFAATQRGRILVQKRAPLRRSACKARLALSAHLTPLQEAQTARHQLGAMALPSAQTGKAS